MNSFQSLLVILIAAPALMNLAATIVVRRSGSHAQSKPHNPSMEIVARKQPSRGDAMTFGR